jgi:hypothetical protein
MTLPLEFHTSPVSLVIPHVLGFHLLGDIDLWRRILDYLPSSMSSVSSDLNQMTLP